jgi:hypothetical protein
MHKSLIVAGILGALAVPAAAQADDSPTNGDRQNASQECRSERGVTAATREAFAAHYGTNKNRSNAFGKCVSAKSREEVKEREEAEGGASQTCRSERGTTAETRAAFEQKYGTNKHKKNAFGKCVSQAAKAAKGDADDKDHDAIADRKSAAKQCAQERGTTSASRDAFAEKYGTNGSKRNAFGKCVSKLAKTLAEQGARRFE